MAKQSKYVYGPVPSRRLGLSLGVDIVPAKFCTLDCVYCQLGRTTDKITQRRNFVDIEKILAELREKLAEGIQADYVTIGGSGEPTLNAQLGKLIEGIKSITTIPVAILTNSTLFYQRDVRSDCARVDVVLPSLDAGDEETFRKVNRPHKDISIEMLVSGLCAFRKEFTGQIWLEVFLVEEFNSQADQIVKIKKAIELIRPDKVQLNTAVRPTAEAGVVRLTTTRLKGIAAQLGQICEIVPDFQMRHFHRDKDEGISQTHSVNTGELQTLLSLLKRRPCSISDICEGLTMTTSEALKYVYCLQEQGLIDSEEKDGLVFYKALI